jgi:hypothetical protein
MHNAGSRPSGAVLAGLFVMALWLLRWRVCCCSLLAQPCGLQSCWHVWRCVSGTNWFTAKRQDLPAHTQLLPVFLFPLHLHLPVGLLYELLACHVRFAVVCVVWRPLRVMPCYRSPPDECMFRRCCAHLATTTACGLRLQLEGCQHQALQPLMR